MGSASHGSTTNGSASTNGSTGTPTACIDAMIEHLPRHAKTTRERPPHMITTTRRQRLRNFPAAALIMMATTLTACGSSASTGKDTTIQPFDDIRASEVTFEPDPTDPSRHLAHVTTNVPTICAIIWGLDDHLGRFNNSLSMNGTGITQHDVILPDVEPGTTYRYLIEAIAADGTLYRSEMSTFTVQTASAATSAAPITPPGDDITGRATVTNASSEYSIAFAAANAIDGDPATEWATNGDGDDAFITLDLGSVTDVTGVEFVTRSMADGTATTATYTVTIDDGAPLGPFDAATTAHPNPVKITATGRVIRFDIASSSGGNVGATEIRIFG
jgi:hypothetical protein